MVARLEHREPSFRIGRDADFDRPARARLNEVDEQFQRGRAKGFRAGRSHEFDNPRAPFVGIEPVGNLLGTRHCGEHNTTSNWFQTENLAFFQA